MCGTGIICSRKGICYKPLTVGITYTVIEIGILWNYR